MTSSTISGNSTNLDDGGGISVERGNLTETSSTISGNSAGQSGGGIRIEMPAANTALIVSSTISGNSATEDGGGLSIESGSTTIRYSTITNNSAPVGMGGGVALKSPYMGTSQVDVRSTIIAGNIGSDVNAFIEGINTLLQSNGYNLIGIGNAIGAFNQTGDRTGVVNPMLDSLADNGGPTRTHALAGGSPAIDAGDPAAVAGVGNVPLYDQRGTPFTRVIGRIDLGAFETETVTFVVDTLADESDGDYSAGDFSLREAIELANLATDAVTIHFDPSIHGGTILLTQGPLAITRSMFIDGPGAKLITVDASGNDPTPGQDNGDGSEVFRINDIDFFNLINVEITGLTLTGGDSDSNGGGIFNRENLTVVDCVITGNAADIGGGIYHRQGNATIVNSTISGNLANVGGGIDGATYPYGVNFMNVIGSTISGNSATRGGGVYNHSGLTVIRFSTITGNIGAAVGLGSGVISQDEFTRTDVYSSIIAGNVNSDVNVVGGAVASFRSSGYNLIGTGNALANFNQPGDQTGVTNPLLGPLADNGGPTKTHLLLTGSPAIDRGDPAAVAGSGNVPLYDQRGAPFTRVFDGDGAGARESISALTNANCRTPSVSPARIRRPSMHCRPAVRCSPGRIIQRWLVGPCIGSPRRARKSSRSTRELGPAQPDHFIVSACSAAVRLPIVPWVGSVPAGPILAAQRLASRPAGSHLH